MAAKKQHRIAIRSTENIAMLHLLHRVPALPSLNIITDIQSKQTGYSLPFAEERRLAAALAFLAHIKDGPDHIPAVCLQERPKQQSINILLAVNKGRPEDGKAYLSRIKGGFERIAATLSSIEDQAPDVETLVFAVIIELCEDRILCRLRLKKKKRDSADQTRTNVIDGLRKVIDYLSNDSSENTKLFLREARNVLKLAVSWKKHQVVSDLKEVVEAVNSLRQTEKFKEILESIPNRHVAPSTRCHLVNMICKVSRYRESARILFRAARKSVLVRQMHVVVVELPNEAFKPLATSADYCPDIRTPVSRASNLTKSQKDVKQICDLLKISVQAADTEYGKRVGDTLKNSKIHAEIQLLYYYQITLLHGQLSLPRVICSSKSACWLCNAFILHHGKIYTPRSHGRLYPGWRLPNLHGGWFNDIAATFNQRLENVLANSLKTLHRRREKTTYNNPIESTVSTITWLSGPPNDQKLPDNLVKNEELEESNTVLVQDITESVKGAKTTSRDKTNSEEVPAKGANLKDCTSSDTPLSWSPVSTIISSASENADTSSVDASQGPQENAQIYRVALGDISPIYPSGPLQLQFEYAGGHQQPTYSHCPRQLVCAVEWLSREAFQRLELKAGDVIDAGSLTGEEVSYSTDTADNIYLRAEETVLKLTMRPLSSATDASRKPQES
ncbi:hypothetical protein F4803DRAFT_528485 [Xylaria telfairii]|nr:hypothetical protein F4803DRAFT_528485 [Xylaria telfairii]